jgi:hypothetical protein
MDIIEQFLNATFKDGSPGFSACPLAGSNSGSARTCAASLRTVAADIEEDRLGLNGQRSASRLPIGSEVQHGRR